VRVDGCTVKEAVAELPFSEAESVTEDWVPVILAAVAVNIAVVAVAATVTDGGTVSTELFDESATAEPAEGAAADRVTVQLEVLPEATAAGAHTSPVTVGGAGVTVTAEVAVVAFREAVTVAA
jgi:hypothetical protein